MYISKKLITSTHKHEDNVYVGTCVYNKKILSENVISTVTRKCCWGIFNSF